MSSLYPATALFLDELQRNAEIVGIYLVGSKSRGYDDERSDDDLEVVLAHTSNAHIQCVEQLFDNEKLVCDIRYLTLAQLQQKCASCQDTDHWPYQHARILFDRDGVLKPLIQTLGSMNETFRQKRIRYSTVGTTISIGKACKAFQRGYQMSGRMTLARGVKSLARLLFALELRWTPTDHWLEKDLQSLNDPAHVSPLLIEALVTDNPQCLRKAIQQLEVTFPLEVPQQEERVRIYDALMHPDQSEDRTLHLLF